MSHTSWPSGSCSLSIPVISNFRPSALEGHWGLLLSSALLNIFSKTSTLLKDFYKSYSHLLWSYTPQKTIPKLDLNPEAHLGGPLTWTVSLPRKLAPDTQSKANKLLIDGWKWHFSIFNIFSSKICNTMFSSITLSQIWLSFIKSKVV